VGGDYTRISGCVHCHNCGTSSNYRWSVATRAIAQTLSIGCHSYKVRAARDTPDTVTHTECCCHSTGATPPADNMAVRINSMWTAGSSPDSPRRVPHCKAKSTLIDVTCCHEVTWASRGITRVKHFSQCVSVCALPLGDVPDHLSYLHLLCITNASDSLPALRSQIGRSPNRRTKERSSADCEWHVGRAHICRSIVSQCRTWSLVKVLCAAICRQKVWSRRTDLSNAPNVSASPTSQLSPHYKSPRMGEFGFRRR
jgi:hypothetical protein